MCFIFKVTFLEPSLVKRNNFAWFGKSGIISWTIPSFVILGWFSDSSRNLKWKKLKVGERRNGQKYLWTLNTSVRLPESAVLLLFQKIKFTRVEGTSQRALDGVLRQKLKPKDYYLLSEFCLSFNGKRCTLCA